MRFQNPVAGDYLQPDAVTCEVMDPSGATTTPIATFDAELATPDGVIAPGYWVEIDAETPGAWYYRFDATGAGQSANEGTFYVERSGFLN